MACGGRGEATVYDTRNFAVRAVLQGACSMHIFVILKSKNLQS